MANGLPSRDLIISSFRLQKNGLTPVGKPTYEEWVSCGKFIQDAEQSVQFWIGDWLVFGEKPTAKCGMNRLYSKQGETCKPFVPTSG